MTKFSAIVTAEGKINLWINVKDNKEDQGTISEVHYTNDNDTSTAIYKLHMWQSKNSIHPTLPSRNGGDLDMPPK